LCHGPILAHSSAELADAPGPALLKAVPQLARDHERRALPPFVEHFEVIALKVNCDQCGCHFLRAPTFRVSGPATVASVERAGYELAGPNPSSGRYACTNSTAEPRNCAASSSLLRSCR